MGAGLFGKLPDAGDFVARALPAGVRPALDRWLTNDIAPLAVNATGWPEGGLRAAMTLAGSDWLCVVEPSEDAVGRSYPLVGCVPLNTADREAADRWADAAWPLLLSAVDNGLDADALADRLAELAIPTAARAALSPPALWWTGVEPGPPPDLLPQLGRLSSG